MAARTVYYTATTLDGFIATDDDSIDWLMVQDIDNDGLLNYDEFIAGVGALVMGASTYVWLHGHLSASGESWPYTLPSWVMTHRDLPVIPGADVRFAAHDIRSVHQLLVEAAGGKDVWVVGGGDLAGQFADAGLLDEIIVSVAPVTLGAGKPLLPRRLQLRVLESGRNGAFIATRYAVEHSSTW